MPQYYAYAARDRTSYLAHHGVKGQKWGVRNYQNEDGSLTELGRKRRGLKDYSISNIPKNLKNAASKLGIKVKTKAKEKVAEAKTKAAEKNTPKEGVTRTDYSKKEIKNLTDDELNAVLKRLQAQSKYQNYVNKTSSSIKSNKQDSLKTKMGKTLVGQGLSFVADATLKSIGNRISKNIDKIFNPEQKKKQKIDDNSSIGDVYNQYKKDPTKLSMKSINTMRAIDQGRNQINAMFDWHEKNDDAYGNYLFNEWAFNQEVAKDKDNRRDYSTAMDWDMVYELQHPE